MLARGIKRQNEGLPVRGEGLRDRVKNAFVNIGGVLLKKGTRHVAEQLKNSKNPVAKVTGTVLDVAGHGVGTAMEEKRVEEAMDTQPAPVKPAVVVNKQKDPVAVEAPAPAIPPPSEPNLAKPPPVNRASTKAKSEDIRAGDPTIPPVKAEPASIPQSRKQKAKQRKRKRGKGLGGGKACKRVKSLFS